jgi:hypothetical protein
MAFIQHTAHAFVDTESGITYKDTDWQTDGQFVSWVENYLEPQEVACRVEYDEEGIEILIPLHRKRIFKAWSTRV